MAQGERASKDRQHQQRSKAGKERAIYKETKRRLSEREFVSYFNLIWNHF